MCPLRIPLLPPSLAQGRDKGAPEAARGTALGTPAQLAESSLKSWGQQSITTAGITSSVSQQKPPMSQKVTPGATVLLPSQQGNTTVNTLQDLSQPDPPPLPTILVPPAKGRWCPEQHQVSAKSPVAQTGSFAPHVSEVGNKQLNEQQCPCPLASCQRSPAGQVGR